MRLSIEVAELVRANFDGASCPRPCAAERGRPSVLSHLGLGLGPGGRKGPRDGSTLPLTRQNDDGSYRSWGIEQSIELAKKLKAVGVDLIDVSSGGLLKQQQIKIGKGYQRVDLDN